MRELGRGFHAAAGRMFRTRLDVVRPQLVIGTVLAHVASKLGRAAATAVAVEETERICNLRRARSEG